MSRDCATSPAAITINDGDCSGHIQAKASPYPSSITVSGAPTVLDDVNVIIRGLTRDFPKDIRVLLVDPGLRSVLLMHEAGGSDMVSGANLAFDDAALGPVPAPIVSGTYLPTRTEDGCDQFSEGDALPNPAPVGPYASTLAGFNGHDPNGIWSLYVVDDAAGGVSGSISGGWSLELSPSTPSGTGSPPSTQPGTTPVIPTPSIRKKCKKKHTHRAAASKKSCKKKK